VRQNRERRAEKAEEKEKKKQEKAGAGKSTLLVGVSFVEGFLKTPEKFSNSS
jgi:hypothetical protein